MRVEDDHRHCKVCGKQIGPDEEFCGKAHRQQREESQRSRRNLTYLVYASIAIVVIVFLSGFIH